MSLWRKGKTRIAGITVFMRVEPGNGTAMELIIFLRNFYEKKNAWPVPELKDRGLINR